MLGSGLGSSADTLKSDGQCSYQPVQAWLVTVRNETQLIIPVIIATINTLACVVIIFCFVAITTIILKSRVKSSKKQSMRNYYVQVFSVSAQCFLCAHHDVVADDQQ